MTARTTSPWPTQGIALRSAIRRGLANLATPILLATASFAFAQADSPSGADSTTSRTNPLRTIRTDLGTICILPASGFALEGNVRLVQKKTRQSPVLEFEKGNEGVAGSEFDLPANGHYAVSLLHEGTGPMTLELGGNSFHLPALGEPSQSRRESLLVTTTFLVGAENEVVLRSQAGGKIGGLVFSEPLARLRALALRRSQLMVARQMLEDALLNQIALIRSGGQAAPPEELEKDFAEVEGPLANELQEWGPRYLSLHADYAALHSQLGDEAKPPAPQLGARAAYLEETLKRVSEEMAAIRGRCAPNAPASPSEFRMPAGPLQRGAFESYSWTVLKSPTADPGEGNIELLKVLGIDALVLDPPAWPSRDALDALGDQQVRCLLQIPRRFRPGSESFTLSRDEDSNRDLDDLWGPQYSSYFRHFLESRIGPYRGHPAVLGCSYWPDASLSDVAKEGRTPTTAELTSWDDFLRRSGASASPSTSISGPQTPPDSAGVREPPSIVSRLDRAAFLEETLRDHFRQFNECVSRAGGAMPRIGLFNNSEFPPDGKAPGGGVSPFGLLLDAGFPAVGFATGARPAALAYAASLARLDPAGRPWWETAYPIGPSSSETSGGRSTGAYGARIRRDLWRLASWGVRSMELDAGAFCEALYEGPPQAGLLRTELLQTGSLKGSLLALGKIFRNSHIVHHRAALLEPGLPRAENDPAPPADEWTDWFMESRLPPIWVPREVLAQTGSPGVFSEFELLASPGVLVLSEEKGKALEAWIRNGGVLITTDPMGYLSPRGKVVGAFLPALGMELTGEPGHWRLREGSQPAGGVEALRRDAQGEPDMLLVTMGKGHLLVGLGAAGSEEPWRELMGRMAKFVFPVPDVSADADSDDLELHLRENEKGERFLMALNPRLDRHVRAHVRLLGTYPRVLDVTFSQPVPVEKRHAEGVTDMGLALGPGESRLFALGKNESKLTRAETAKALGPEVEE
ncbi:MAG TPA: hypothetical protein VM492_09060 [Sumerlaeia bacterium]|nr:hypothetical protein [Sumerlaeia bacterium]